MENLIRKAQKHIEQARRHLVVAKNSNQIPLELSGIIEQSLTSNLRTLEEYAQKFEHKKSN